MLLNDFFTLTALQNENGIIKASIEINAKHKIFEGHFPGQPIVPGVCMLQISKEIVEQVLGYSIQLQSADHLKFLAFINPVENNCLNAELQYNMLPEETIRVNATLLDSKTTYFKFKGIFIPKK